MMSNKTQGNRFEQELCEILAKNGFWAHNMAQNQAGQPADIIAVKENVAYLIDCKLCSSNYFPLSRVECNQETAMSLWQDCGNTFCFFAIKLPSGEIYMLPFEVFIHVKDMGMRILKEIHMSALPTLPQWLEVYG